MLVKDFQLISHRLQLFDFGTQSSNYSGAAFSLERPLPRSVLTYIIDDIQSIVVVILRRTLPRSVLAYIIHDIQSIVVVILRRTLTRTVLTYIIHDIHSIVVVILR